MIEIEQIDVLYGEFHVLKNVSLSVGRKELTILTGPNGHGKSTLLKAICGLQPVRSGKIRFAGEDITRLSPEHRVEKRIVYIAENRHLFPHMSVLKNLKLGSYTKNARRDEAANLSAVFELFPRLEERKKQPASTLSGGEARMLAFARGLMSNAQFLAIDEPSLGLAPNLRTTVLNAIQEVHKRGLTILLVEQNLPKIAELADRIHLLEEGVLTFSGDRETALAQETIKQAFLGM